MILMIVNDLVSRELRIIAEVMDKWTRVKRLEFFRYISNLYCMYV